MAGDPDMTSADVARGADGGKGRRRVVMKIGFFDDIEHGGRPRAALFDERLAFAAAHPAKL
jgi:hypothetical protein